MSVSWAGLAGDVVTGDHIYIGDGAVRLKVTAARAAEGEVDTPSSSVAPSPPVRV